MKTSELCEKVLRKTLLEPCDHKRRSHREVGCVVADIEDAIESARRDEQATAGLLAACKALLAADDEYLADDDSVYPYYFGGVKEQIAAAVAHAEAAQLKPLAKAKGGS